MTRDEIDCVHRITGAVLKPERGRLRHHAGFHVDVHVRGDLVADDVLDGWLRLRTSSGRKTEHDDDSAQHDGLPHLNLLICSLVRHVERSFGLSLASFSK
jgi:hypothetical protein